MKKNKLLFALLTILLAVVACQHARVRFDDCLHCRTESDQTSQTEKQSFWAWGLHPWTLEYNVYEICPNGLLEVHEYANWLDGLLDNGTAGIYAGRRIALTCAESAAASIQSNPTANSPAPDTDETPTDEQTLAGDAATEQMPAGEDGNPAGTNTEQKPAATEGKPAETITEQEPATTERIPAETITEQEPATTERIPAETITEQEPATTERKPAVTGVEQEPEALESKAVDEAINEPADPPASIETDPLIIETKVQPGDTP